MRLWIESLLSWVGSDVFINATRRAIILKVSAALMFCLTVLEFCQPLTSLFALSISSRATVSSGNGILIGVFLFDLECSE